MPKNRQKMAKNGIKCHFKVIIMKKLAKIKNKFCYIIIPKSLNTT